MLQCLAALPESCGTSTGYLMRQSRIEVFHSLLLAESAAGCCYLKYTLPRCYQVLPRYSVLVGPPQPTPRPGSEFQRTTAIPPALSAPGRWHAGALLGRHVNRRRGLRGKRPPMTTGVQSTARVPACSANQEFCFAVSHRLQKNADAGHDPPLASARKIIRQMPPPLKNFHQN